jgi:hypothetical protein
LGADCEWKDKARRIAHIRLVTMAFSCLFGFAAIANMTGCVDHNSGAGVPAWGNATWSTWVPADYANGKWVPGHCLGQPPQ